MTTDLLSDDLNTNLASNVAGEQSARNWEETAKGLQRKNQQLQSEFQRLQESILAKDQYAQNSAKEVNDLKMRNVEVATTYEGQIASAKAIAAAKEDALLKKEQEHQAALTRIAQLETRDNIRKQLSSEENQDMLGWFESGYLKPVDDNGAPLTGEALTAHLNGFRDRLSGNVQKKVEDTLTGTRPSAPRTGTVAPGNLNQDQLHDWLMQNPDHPDYDRMDENYMELVSKQQKR